MFDLRAWVEAHRWVVLGVLVGAALIGAGVFWTKTQAEPAPVVLSATVSAELVVDIGGEVARPGVYKLSSGARVEEALAAAGGITSDADINYIEKYLNRAMRLLDGQKIYIPRIDAENAQSSRLNAQLNINTASQKELEGLPGIGSERAGKIISNRPYQNISELLSKKIMGQKVYDQIKDQISVW